MLGRQPAGRGRVDGIAHGDGLVVAELTEVRFAVEQRTQVKVADHSQGGRVRRPFGSVTERGIVVADESVDVRFGQASAGDAAGHEDHRPVHGDLDAHQGPWLTLGGEVDDGIGDPVTDLVGMTGADGLCGSPSRSSGDRGHGQVHQFTSRVSWRPVKGARSRTVAAASGVGHGQAQATERLRIDAACTTDVAVGDEHGTLDAVAAGVLGDTADIGAPGGGHPARGQIGEGVVGHLGREAVHGRVHELGAVAHRGREHAEDAHHRAGHVEVDVDAVPCPDATAGADAALVQQDGAAQQLGHDIAPLTAGKGRGGGPLHVAGRADLATLGETAGPAQQRPQPGPVARPRGAAG